MELLFANRLDDVSASIAVHLDRGGQPARAVPFLERAAAVATRVSANEEAIWCLMYALSLLEASRHHFEAALLAYDEAHPRRSTLSSDLGVFAHAWYAHALWLLGDEAAALYHAE